jgi:hypothetical protein
VTKSIQNPMMSSGHKNAPNQITAHNAGWPSQLRCSAFVHFGATGAGSVFWPGVCEFWRSAKAAFAK